MIALFQAGKVVFVQVSLPENRYNYCIDLMTQ